MALQIFYTLLITFACTIGIGARFGKQFEAWVDKLNEGHEECVKKGWKKCWFELLGFHLAVVIFAVYTLIHFVGIPASLLFVVWGY